MAASTAGAAIRLAVATQLIFGAAGYAQAEICVVRAPERDGSYSVGHGVYVGRGIVLTAAHVIRTAAEKPTCRFRGGEVRATDWAKSRDHDLAGLLVVPPAGVKASRVYGRWPTGPVRTLRSQGAVGRRWRDQAGRQLFSFEGPSLPGDSGGPIWSREGVVSIVSTSDYQTGTEGPPPEALVSFLTSWQPMSTQTACGPDCTPYGAQGGIQAGLRPNATPQDQDRDGLPDEPPQAPDIPATPPPRAPLATPSVAELADAVAQRILTDEKLRTALKGEKGPQGLIGPAGPAGEMGPVGLDGQPGKSADVAVMTDFQRQISEQLARIDDLQRQQAELARQLGDATFDVEIVQRNGEVENSAVHAHGGLLRLDFSQKEK